LNKIPQVIKETGKRIEQGTPNTQERPENERKPTNNKPVRKPTGGG